MRQSLRKTENQRSPSEVIQQEINKTKGGRTHNMRPLVFFGQWINTGGGLKQKHKKQPFGDASASHLSLALRHV